MNSPTNCVRPSRASGGPVGRGPWTPELAPADNARVNDHLIKRLAALDTCAVSDALDYLGIPGTTTGIRPMWPGCPRIAGRARTVQVADAASIPGGGRHMATSAVAAATAGDVIVIANRGRTDVS